MKKVLPIRLAKAEIKKFGKYRNKDKNCTSNLSLFKIYFRKECFAISFYNQIPT